MRTFGVELEHISSVSHPKLQLALEKADIGVDRYATGHTYCPQHCYSGWQVKTDGSLTVTEEYPYKMELASPPMLIPRAMTQFQKVLGVARAFGGINTSCSMHVHVSAPELHIVLRNHITAAPLIEKIQRTWTNVERVFYSYVTPSRRYNEFCKRGIDLSDRYHGLNLGAVLNTSRQTIEFRLHQGTLNTTKALAFAALCVKFIDFISVPTQGLDMLEPAAFTDTPMRVIRVQNNVLHIQRTKKKWIVESKVLSGEFDDLADAHAQLVKLIELPAEPLSAFKYPEHGNAMTALCDVLGLHSHYKGYLEARYERMLGKFGPDTGGDGPTPEVEELDNDEFYNEAELGQLDPPSSERPPY